MGIIIRQSIKGTIFNYIGAFIGFLTTMYILTKFLKPEEIGLTKVIYEAAYMIACFALMGTTSSATRFFPFFKNTKNKDNGFFFYLMILPTLGLIIFISIYLSLKKPISAFFSTNSALFVDYYYWVIPLVFIFVYWMTFEAYSNQKMRIAIPKFIREVLVRLILIAVYLSYAFKLISLDVFIACFILTYGIALLVSLFYIFKIGDLTLKHNFSFLNKELRSNISKYTLYLVLGALGGGILNQLDLFMVSSQLGLDYAGIYAIAFYIAVIIEIPSRSITIISSPIAAKALKEGNFNEANALYKKVALNQLISGGLFFIFLWINIDNIFAIIPNGHIYAAGKWVIFFISLSKIISITLGFGESLISFSKYYYWILPFSVLTTTIAIITNLLLIPVLGITGASIATLITHIIIYSAEQWIVLIKIKGNPFSLNIFKFIILLCVAFGLNLLVPVWSENPIIDGLYRTIVVGTPTLIALYKLNISSELSLLISSALQKIIHK